MKHVLFIVGFACFLASPSMGQNYGSDKKVGDKIYVSGEAKSLTAQHSTEANSITRTTTASRTTATGHLTTSGATTGNNKAPNKRIGINSTVSLANINKIRDFAGSTIKYSGRVSEIQDKGNKQILLFSTGASMLKVAVEKTLKLHIVQGDYYSIEGLVQLQDDVPTIHVSEKYQLNVLTGSDRFEAIIFE